jgi:flagellar biosynthetic protein FlhB
MRQLVVMMQSGLQFSKPITLVDHISEWTSGAFLIVLLVTGVILLIIWIISIFAPLFLVNFKAYFALQFNLERLDVFAGFARMFSVTVLLEMVKNIFKTILILGISFAYLYGLFTFLRSIINLDFNLALENTSSFIVSGFILLMAPLLAIAIGDAFLQLFNFRKQIKMSPEEMKQELKESEGSPELKARMRQRQRQIASSRMMSAIERADVVLANPEHYAVAIRYDPERMSAPIILAKGSDALALRIREVATEHKVPIAQIPPLARYLFNQLDIGESIPAPLFEAAPPTFSAAGGGRALVAEAAFEEDKVTAFCPDAAIALTAPFAVDDEDNFSLAKKAIVISTSQSYIFSICSTLASLR